MKFGNGLIIATLAAVVASCGQSSTKNAADSDTTRNDSTGTVMNNNMNDANDTVPPSNYTYNTEVTVPDQTRQSFQSKYPTASNVTWHRYQPYEEIDWNWAGWPSLDTNAYVVTYTDNGTEYNAWYDRNNNWVGTVSGLGDEKSVPPAVTDVLNKSYSGYTVTSINKENDKNRTVYEIKMEQGDNKAKLLVDEKGNIIKKVVDTGGKTTKEKNY